MPALGARIHGLISAVKDVAGRDKPGHDGLCFPGAHHCVLHRIRDMLLETLRDRSVRDALKVG